MREYGRVDLPTVYQVATIHMPKLLEPVKAIIRQKMDGNVLTSMRLRCMLGCALHGFIPCS